MVVPQALEESGNRHPHADDGSDVLGICESQSGLQIVIRRHLTFLPLSCAALGFIREKPFHVDHVPKCGED